jgi:hypothetical protein
MRLLGVILVLATLIAGCSIAGTSASPARSIDPSPGPTLTAAPSAAGETTPTPARSPSGTASSPAASPTPPSMGPRPTFPVGAGLVTVTDGLRVRSKPEVSGTSTKYEPTLPKGTELHVLAGPEAGSGYWWYRVELGNGQTLYDGVHEGWVAAGARDGTPWVDWITDVDCYDSCPPTPAPVTGWPTVKRGQVVLTGELRGDPDPNQQGGLAVEATVAGLLPGTVVHLSAAGTYSVEWVCADPAGIEAKGPATVDLVTTDGSATAEGDAVAGAAGTATRTLIVRPTRPTQPCPAGFSGPLAWSGRWQSVRVSDLSHGLVLTPPPTFWDAAL